MKILGVSIEKGDTVVVNDSVAQVVSISEKDKALRLRLYKSKTLDIRVMYLPFSSIRQLSLLYRKGNKSFTFLGKRFKFDDLVSIKGFLPLSSPNNILSVSGYIQGVDGLNLSILNFSGEDVSVPFMFISNITVVDKNKLKYSKYSS